MSEDKLSQEARKAYAEAQKEFDEAAAHEAEKVSTAQNSAETEVKAKSGSKNGKNADSAAEHSSHSHVSPGDSAGHENGGGAQAGGQPAADEADELTGELAHAQEDRIATLNQDLDRAKDDLARARADLYNLQQEYSNYAKRTKAEIPQQQEAGVASVVDALMGVLDDIDLARQHGDLEGPFGAVATKLESTLQTRFKVKRYGKVGDTFDPNLHQAIQMAPGADDGGEHIIDAVAQPGYLMGERVLRAAMVVVGVEKSPSADQTSEA
ncbi:nucleotide exchange factor GrpE [Mobiluncus curtisii]|uniref:nucleotide exchange factor GrpE n=1 Tax=Mobiluncus curtisii TaxID=2051 RepID=UPI0014705344|nr:nucleotide exchange factor GrpE [Mobiluncus curtisii]NMW45229.1 nucleotide exchange factor GrpE [Mobiluncus curtisii]NMW98977.1 nucleotide exchange factor GrpE [Mobiluncus curtisii]